MNEFAILSRVWLIGGSALCPDKRKSLLQGAEGAEAAQYLEASPVDAPLARQMGGQSPLSRTPFSPVQLLGEESQVCPPRRAIPSFLWCVFRYTFHQSYVKPY